MRNDFICILFFMSIFFYHRPLLGKNVDYVNSLIGTAQEGEGGTAPFVCSPFSMTNFLPQTRENKMGSMAYVYDDKYIIGFLASHQPTCWMGDYGYVSVMPQNGDSLKLLPNDRKLAYSHKTEQATPYYYKVDMLLGNKKFIRTEFSACSKSAIFRITYPQNRNNRIIVHGINLNPSLTDWCNDFGKRIKNLRGWIKVNAEEGEIIGYNPDRQSFQLGPELKNFKGYFVIKFDAKIENYGTWDNENIFPQSKECTGTRMGAYVEFEKLKAGILTFKISTSFISIEQARRNMQAELDGHTLESLASRTRKEWNAKLSKIDIEGADKNEMAIFYSALYRCYLFPREFSEDGRYYSPFDDKIHKGYSYTDFSLWDTFRAYHPLMFILEPSLSSRWITSLLQSYKEGGWIPMWPNPSYTNIMIGTHADAVISDAITKGITNFDLELAYEAMMKNATVPPDSDTQRKYGDRDLWQSFEARAGLSYYHSIGYVPDDKTAESVSRTIEYSIDDWCIAQVAKILGKEKEYDSLITWSINYRNLFCKETGFFLPRLYDGTWIDQDNTSHHGFTEGSKWTYLFGAMHDVEGMITLMGGPKKFEHMLDRNFNENFYRHSNEPGHHYIYLYNWCNRHDKVEKLVKECLKKNYKNAPNGLAGNEDCGQMSAWYIFSAMGFYPVCPASGLLSVGKPLFDEMTLNLEDGRKIKIYMRTIEDDNMDSYGLYIDGIKYNVKSIKYEDFINAREIIFNCVSM